MDKIKFKHFCKVMFANANVNPTTQNSFNKKNLVALKKMYKELNNEHIEPSYLIDSITFKTNK